MRDPVRFGCWAAFWGDTPRAIRQVLDVPDVHYLVGDHLAEITMALLARARAKDPDAGFVPDVVPALSGVLAELAERGIKVVTNAGALNPRAAAATLQRAADEAGVGLRVAAVVGDDLLPEKDRRLATHPDDLFTGARIPEQVSSMNAYLGAFPIARALDEGADIVVTGRCVDAAVVLGPLIHEYGWRTEDHDLLSAGTLVGHLVECGPQGTGGLHTDWWTVPGWDRMGYPVAEVRPDGTATITKPDGTGGLVTPATVAEQLVYEIGDPGAYVMPDVVCDWRDVRLTQEGPDRVGVSGALGGAPTRTYKVTATVQDGFRVMATAMLSGLDAAGRARRLADAAVARTQRLLADEGFAPLTHVSIEVIGGGDTTASDVRSDAATEVVVKIGLRHAEKDALQVFARELAPLALVAMGMTGLYGGRPRPAPVFSVHHLLADKATTPVHVVLGDREIEVDVVPGDRDTPDASPRLSAAGAARPGGAAADPDEGPTTTVPLRRIAYGRSGDKGDKANVGLIARRPEFLDLIRTQVTEERMRGFFAHYDAGAVDAWELPGIHAVNYLIDAVLGGTGGTSSLRYDTQGKSYAAMVLGMPVRVPARWLDRLAPTGAPA